MAGITKITKNSIQGIDTSADATAITIDSSEKVGINTSSPSKLLHINSSTSISANDIYDEVLRLDNTSGKGTNSGIGISFYQGANERARISNLYMGAGQGLAFDVRQDGQALAEAMRLDMYGFAKHTTTGAYDTYIGADDSHQFVSDNTGHSTLWITNQNASYDSSMLRTESNRGGNSAFTFLTATSGNLTDDQFKLRGDGQAYADGSWNGGGADYAEYFEWQDGNTSNEDRVGYSVVLEGDKIRKATDTDNASNIIGVISGNPFVVGDTSWNKWNEKYLRDDFGRYIWEEYTVTEWEEEIIEGEEAKTIKKSFETDKIPSDEIVPNDATIISQETNGDNLKRRKLNPNYDETLDYIPRENRKEWSTVGLLGKLRIRKGQPVGDRWIKMKDISDTVEEWLVR